MIIEVKVPSPGESVTEVEIGSWLVENGAVVEKNQEIAEIESDKATLTITAPDAGKIEMKAEEGQTIEVGTVICTIDTSEITAITKNDPISRGEEQVGKEEEKSTQGNKEIKAETREETKEKLQSKEKEESELDRVKITPVAKELMKEYGLSVEDVIKGLRRLGKKEVEIARDPSLSQVTGPADISHSISRDTDRQRMTPFRRKLSERLVAVKNETAMLTTFNEIDMGNLMDLRKRYQQPFQEKFGIRLGFMSFFAKAAALAMDFHPMVNARIEGDEIVQPRFVDIGIAVSTTKGLIVPVVRNAESKSIPEIEKEIKELAEKARSKKISLDELSGGTFTITNGGVFGSLLSTPIINPPQSAILGMHNIADRPVAINNKVVIRPMMYIALSYDHRIIDGKDSVGFLVKIKKFIENPDHLMTNGKEPTEVLLGL